MVSLPMSGGQVGTAVRRNRLLNPRLIPRLSYVIRNFCSFPWLRLRSAVALRGGNPPRGFDEYRPTVGPVALERSDQCHLFEAVLVFLANPVYRPRRRRLPNVLTEPVGDLLSSSFAHSRSPF